MASGALRDGRKEAIWRRHVRAQARCGISVRGYCTARGLREYSFYWWRRELGRRDADPPRSPATFVPVAVIADRSAPTPAGRIEIVLSGDRRVRVTGAVNRQLLSDVLSVLEQEAQRC